VLKIGKWYLPAYIPRVRLTQPASATTKLFSTRGFKASSNSSTKL
jgi:hypothetical protein